MIINRKTKQLELKVTPSALRAHVKLLTGDSGTSSILYCVKYITNAQMDCCLHLHNGSREGSENPCRVNKSELGSHRASEDLVLTYMHCFLVRSLPCTIWMAWKILLACAMSSGFLGALSEHRFVNHP